jgi:hypothetical protein
MINPNHQAPIHRRSVASNPKLKVVTNSSDNLQYTMHVIQSLKWKKQTSNNIKN